MQQKNVYFPQQPICCGTVLQNQDKDHPYQVKVRLAVLYEEGYNETWAYLAAPYGGMQYGICFVPEVGEQVLVVFPFGGMPIVLSSVCGAKEAPSECQDNQENQVKVIKTKGGNLILMRDQQEHAEIQVQTAGGLCMQFSDEGQKIIISGKDTKNSVTVDAENGNVTISAEKSIVLEIGGSAVLQADQNVLILKNSKITIQADQALEEKGGQMKLSGQIAEFSASGPLTISSDSVLKLNK